MSLRIAGVGAGAVVIAVLPRLISNYHAYQFAFVGIYFIALLGLNILTGYSGQISLGHGAFMGIGAYTTAILTVHHGVRDIWTIPLAGLVAGVAGYLFGLPALRLAGVYLALATFALPVALSSLEKHFRSFTGGGTGIILHLPKAELGFHATPSRWLYYLTWCIAAVLFAVAWLLVRGRTGRALRSLHTSEVAAAASGVNIAAFKTFAFGVSAFYAGVAGSLYAIAVAFLNPDTFTISLSILLLTGVVVAGLGSLNGIVFGALFIEFVPLDAQNISKQAPSVVYGLVLIALLLIMPTGAAGLLNSTFRLLRRQIYSRQGRKGVALAPSPEERT
jgi:branched-chain amino acid transport system permease protein